MSGHENNSLLLERVKNGDPSAESELISANMGLVKSIAIRFSGRGEDCEDLIQLGAIGLLKAVRGYDPSFGTAFSTYAVPMIIGEIRRFLRDNGPIKVGRSIKALGIKISAARGKFVSENFREPTVGELSEILGVDAGEIVNAASANTPTLSLQELICGDSSGSDSSDGMTLESLLRDENTSPEIELLIEKMSLESALSELDANQQKLVHLRYVRGFTQEQTGRILGISQVKVSRTEKKIMAKLREKLGD